jgi:hypothetical protein
MTKPMTETISTVRQWLDVSTRSREMLKIPKPEGYLYSCMEEYVNANGVDFSSEALTEREMVTVMDAVDRARMRFQIKQCFYNAQMLVLADDSGDLIYHEGWAFGKAIIAVHHGWASINGKVIDLTWRLDQTLRKRGRLRDRIIGLYPEGYEYVGVPFPDKRHLREKMLDRGWVGSQIDDWENRWPLLRGET